MSEFNKLLGNFISLLRSYGFAFVAIALLGFSVQTAHAHDARPLSIAILEQASGIYRVVMRVPPSLQFDEAPTLVWPSNCEVHESTSLSQASGSVSIVRCGEGLQGREIKLTYPQFNPSLTTLFRLQTLAGGSITKVLPPDELAWQVPVEPAWYSVAAEYSILGMQHIWEGPDHLLFVFGLLLLARRPRKIVFAITGFTIAHSITLCLATLKLVQFPVPLVEALIALSIVFLAVEIARNDLSSFSHRFPIALSFVFGLLHGFGFASALSEIGLPANDLAIGLLFFNVGVELGQLAFIAVVALLVAIWHRTGKRIQITRSLVDWPRFMTYGAYLLGIPGAYWFVERATTALLS